MKKKVIFLISVVLSLLMVASGCVQKAPPASSQPAPAASTKENAAAASTQPVKKLDFPTKPITLIVQQAPGGSTDIIARTMTKKAEQFWGKPVTIEYVEGAGGVIGLNKAVESKADGYTLIMASSTIITQPIMGESKYDYSVKLKPLGQIQESTYVLTVNADSQFKTLEDLVDFGKKNPGVVQYGHSGVGNSSHITAEVFQKRAGVTFEAVPFQSGSQLVTALLGNHLAFVINNPIDVLPQVKAGKLRILACASEKRLDIDGLKDVPTFIEKKYDVLTYSRNGLAVQRDVPDDVYKFLCDGFEKMAKDPETKDALIKAGVVYAFLDANEYSKKWVSEQERLKKELAETGILDMIKAQKK